MSFSKAKLKRFNDVDVICGSPAACKFATPMDSPAVSTSASASSLASTASATSGHCDRKEQIEKFFKDAVRFASNGHKETNNKEFAMPKDSQPKEDKKHKGLRLFRTPSLPQRLRFRPHADTPSKDNKDKDANTPTHSALTTPIKNKCETKSASRLKGKDALQEDIRKKNEMIESYLSQIDVLQRHVQQLKETELKLREENTNANMKTDQLMHELKNEKEQLCTENGELQAKMHELECELADLNCRHIDEVSSLKETSAQLEARNAQLSTEAEDHLVKQRELRERLEAKQAEVGDALEKLQENAENAQKNYEMLENIKNQNMALIEDVKQLKQQIEHDTLNYAQEARSQQMEIDLLKIERNTLKNDLASKCDLIRSLQDELLDKNCEIDAHCDTIRDMCREKAKYAEKERLMETAEQQVQKMESDLEKALAQEKHYWQTELEKRQKMAENEIIKIELEKQDVMVLLETTNDMLRDRDEKIQKYEEQLRNGLNYYIQLTDTLQKQLVDLKQDMAKVISEKYNYQLTLNNTRATVNILMERLKKSDAGVERFRAELESVQLAKGALEDSYLTLQQEMEALRENLQENENALRSMRESAQTLQQEVCVKESMLNEMLSSEEETLTKFNKIASSFQERIDTDAARYAELYNELKHKDERREHYMQDMKKALDEFSTVLQIAQIEIDSKENMLLSVRDECEKLKLENITLKSKIEENITKKENNSTDLEKIEDLLIDTELRAECDKIATWLLNSSTDKCVRDNAHEINELLKPSTPNSRRVSAPHTPKSPRTPKTPRTPKKTVLFAASGKENVLHSPTAHALKPRNV